MSPGRRVFITGVGAISPLGEGLDAFYEGLRSGRSGTRRVTLVQDPLIESQVAAEVPDFDPLRHISALDSKRVPRLIPMAIGAAREALRQAGYDPDALPEQDRRGMGVIVGTGGGGIEFAEMQYRELYLKNNRHVTPYCVSSSFVGMLSSEISIAFGLYGPSHVLSTGCTSSTDAIGYAYRQIKTGQAEALVTGGAEACITQGLLAGFGRMKVAAARYNETPERASRPFDRDRDGFVLGEGAWMLMVESEESALRRGARVLAEITGYGSTCEAYHRVAVKNDGIEPARAMRLALQEAGVDPARVGCVQLHGTGTRLNDPAEARAMGLVFGERSARVAATALKSQIGHPQGACGAAGVSAAVFTLTRGIVPPTINYDNPDPECPLDVTPNRARSLEVDHVLCNTIAFGSKNSALLISRAPVR
ncbi:MAG: 3-oxoacyl-[acyl-carrier-protein] synthase 2 [Candidatus Omnitrophica bacterium]|nr:3-oxoacyl-[acyl-carrier-protein] synthase 2 [Candidatus Omnitrophota bacterium]